MTLTGCDSDRLLKSPDGEVEVTFSLSGDGVPCYAVQFCGKEVIAPSTMGFELKDMPALTDRFKILNITRESVSEKWVPVWGENDTILNEYNEMTVELAQGDRLMNIQFRAYDDGVGFRYVFPEQKGLETFVITDELTQMAMTGDHTAWWIPGDYDTQEYEYNKTRLSEIRAVGTGGQPGNVSATAFSPTGVQTSLMLKTDDGIYLNLHEAALVDYPAMHLDYNDSTMTFTSWLTPGRDGSKAVITTPFVTPWRVIMVSDKATDILATDIIYNLNEPCKIDDTSWIHPVKYMGVWWEMITGKSSWAYCDASDFDLATFDYAKARPNGRHGANNANVRRYIDFAAANGMDQLLIEGWNVGWEDWFGKEKDYVFDFVTPYPDFDIAALNEYAHSKGIKLMMHHETSGSIPNYERHMDAAYDLMNKYGYDAVKSGYVGNILPKGENHYSQSTNNHYLNAIKKAAEKHIMVNAHEAVRPTGLARTYPNLVGNESAMGTEYRQMSPGHVTILPFTRLKGGPMDFTPGIFHMDMSTFVPGSTDRKRATVANQLALYLTMYSPLQMAADFPEHYAEKMDAFQFIKDVPVDWKKSVYLDAEPGEFIIVARQDKNSDDWYVGGVTNADARDYELKFDFLPAGVEYDATVYADAPDAHCDTNPEAYVISRREVTAADSLPVHMASG
ncbi:MAG: glycoside hydrolase family 97 protein, partial [Muribaculaceae bacterium]|nr:glycoside hydrolase family 97 protein [Muribaculaceae bacterium]